MNELQKLLKQKAALDDKIAATRQAEKAEVVADIRTKIAMFAFTERELGLHMKAPRVGAPQRKPSAAMYQHPETGVTWSGRGRTPGWIIGQERSRFLIQA
ncbi:H-NS histone family protein [Robbsia sp. Bb-Pol-6]|uniref:H-NS histone family protein n=1 Tax=Robbsia betulipollinis TaxID=2981849 RepID=A0ABT3ZJE1_9BURK|nr:H-NS histone family protein [Robbsia betulipollinis]MCY0386527.1 H-NS histone family protein [Robbsia betulipollinis]